MTRLRRAAITIGTSIALVSGGATAAFATSTPPSDAPATLPAMPTHTPTALPTGTPTAGTPDTLPATPPAPAPFRPERFSVLESLIGGVRTNVVKATGPIAFTNAADAQVNNTEDKFTLGANTVNVFHNGIPRPTLDAVTCTATLGQNGSWAFFNGTGIDAAARGFGTYALAAIFHFPDVRGACPLTGLRPSQVQRDLISNTGLPAPDFYTLGIQGQGLASR